MIDLLVDNEENSEVESFQWHVLNLAKNRENVLARSLRGLSDANPDKIRDIFLPMQTVVSWKNQKQVKRDVPTKPGYLFVEAVGGYLDTKEVKLQIQTGYRVLGTITQSEIELMRNDCVEIEEPDEQEIKVGSEVSINKGIFMGFTGVVQRINENDTLTVRVFFMNAIEIDVSRSDIGPNKLKEEM